MIINIPRPLENLAWVFILSISLSSCVSISEFFYGRICPDDMEHVQNLASKVNICVDRYEYTISNASELENSKPIAGVNYYECKRLCAKKGRRMLKHHEWLIACKGTDANNCNKHRAHPVLRRLASNQPWKFGRANCKNRRYTWGSCLQDKSLNSMPKSLARNGEFEDCISNSGLRHMIGNLGEWVEDLRKRRGKIYGRFNGGLYPQKKSSCSYTTIAHGPGYKDYSIGCRCASSVINTDNLDQ
ncbi:MAG: SUMF1/EgtB/PvdO family nonheme iron enzyme [Oligoflexales bacterium]